MRILSKIVLWMLLPAGAFAQPPQAALNSFLTLARNIPKDETLFPELVAARDKLVTTYRTGADKKAIRIAEDSATDLLLAGVWRLCQANKMDLSLRICAQVIEFRKAIDPTDIRPYDMMTLYSVYKGDLDKAVFYGLKAASIQENSGSSELSERPYDNLGKAYAELGKNDLALTYYQRAISILRKKDTVVYGEILKNITQLLIRMGRPEQALAVVNDNISSRSFADPYDRQTIKEVYGNCYFALGQYGKAENNYLERYDAVAKMHDKVELLIASVPLAKLYIKIHAYDKAGFYLTQLAGDSNKGWEPISVQRDVQNMLYQADSAREEYVAAIGHLKQYKLLNDSIFNTAKNRQIEELRVQYETVEKDQHIQLLTVIRDVSLAGAVLLVLLLVLVYSRYRVKRKNNIVLRTQKEIIRQNNLELQVLNDSQNKLLAEKEWLMKEVQHRVKNNLQIIISLLNAQAEFLDNPVALNAIIESRERMQAMALIHQRLYLSNEDTLIGMRSYVREIVEYLESGLSTAGRISFEVAVDEIELDIAQVVPLGLMINEAITNAIKYAFPDGRSGVVRIVMLRTAEDKIRMTISDNGVGFTRNAAIAESNSFGIQLIRLFAEQLEGTLRFETERGVSISLLFKQQQRVAGFPHLLTRHIRYGENIDR